MVGLYGGSFDPPHRGHVELARRAKEELGLDRLVVLVSADPGHKRVDTPADARLRLARAAFPDDEVLLDEHARTVDTLRAHPEWGDPVFVIGADQFVDFPSWKEPQEVLRAHAPRGRDPARASRSERLEGVLAQLEQPERVLVLRHRADPGRLPRAAGPPGGGTSVAGEVPAAVAALIEAETAVRPLKPGTIPVV